MINKKANNHKMSIVNGFINIGTFILLFLLPVSCIITVAIKQEYLILNPLNWLWAGFYGSVLNIFLIKRKLLNNQMDCGLYYLWLTWRLFCLPYMYL